MSSYLPKDSGGSPYAEGGGLYALGGCGFNVNYVILLVIVNVENFDLLKKSKITVHVKIWPYTRVLL